MIKTIHRAVGIATVLMILLFAAFAEAPLLFSMDSVTTEFFEAGEADVHVHLENTADRLITDVAVTDEAGETLVDAGTLQPGEAADVTVHAQVTEDALDAGMLTLYTRYTDNGAKEELVMTLSVVRVYPRVEAEFLRRISTLSGPQDGEVTVVYIVRNTGNAKLTDLRVRDGDFDERAESLEPGHTKVFVNSVTLTGAYESKPTLYYSAEASDSRQERTLTPETVTVAVPSLTAELTATRSLFADDSSEVVLRLTNNGTAGYTDITVYDEIYGGIIAEGISIPAGSENSEIAMNYPIRGDGIYCWHVTGFCDTGEPVDIITRTITLQDTLTGGDVRLNADVNTETPTIKRAGIVRCSVELDNLGVDMARRVIIREETRGELRYVPVVPTGDATVCTVKLYVNATETLHFYVDYEDASGTAMTADAGELTFTIASNGVEPEQEGTELLGGNATRAQTDRSYTWTLATGIAVVAILLVLLLVTSIHAGTRGVIKSQKRRKRRSRSRKEKKGKAENAADAESDKEKHRHV